jgi:hypothetical protein
MPIWLELLALMLMAYAIGLAIGWTIWGGVGTGGNERETRQ